MRQNIGNYQCGNIHLDDINIQNNSHGTVTNGKSRENKSIRGNNFEFSHQNQNIVRTKMLFQIFIHEFSNHFTLLFHSASIQFEKQVKYSYSI